AVISFLFYLLKTFCTVFVQIKAELGMWMEHFLVPFLTDGHFTYLGWIQYDKQMEVQPCCVWVLQGLYVLWDMAAQMELFTGCPKGCLLAVFLLTFLLKYLIIIFSLIEAQLHADVGLLL
uniref:SCD domain-containing protein n=1 Tax=Gallus gallus TaxID=9031 RepID=A0A8V0ZMH7_CHICK